MPARPASILSLRALNRAFLARQHLLVRAALPASRAIEHLVGLQAQVPRSPYFALWSRLQTFRPEDVERLILGKRAVRMLVMRGTLHLVSARDALALRPTLQPVLDRGLHTGSPYGRGLRGLSPAQVVAVGKALVEERPHTQAQMRDALAKRFPTHDATALAYVVHYLLPMVQLPPRGLWSSSGLPTWTTQTTWLKRTAAAMPLATLVLRYLRAFGPASVMDAQAWSGLRGLGPVFEALRPRLRSLRDPGGRELFDLPAAPRPHPDTPAPPRFLPDFDNAFLSHADRTRIVAAERGKLFSKTGPPLGVILLDGFIEGSWKLEAQKGKGDRAAPRLEIQTFRKITRDEGTALREEGQRLLDFAVEGKGSVRIGRR